MLAYEELQSSGRQLKYCKVNVHSETIFKPFSLGFERQFPAANRSVVETDIMNQTQTINHSNLVEKCATCTTIGLRSSELELL